MVNSPEFAASRIAGTTVLVVESDAAERAFCMATLASVGLSTAGTGSFISARMSLVAQPPAVLVAEVRRDDYNGLDLARLGRLVAPQMAIVITSTARDRVLRRCAEELGAAFVVKPLTTSRLFAAVYRAVLAEPHDDRTREQPAEWPHEEYRRLSVADPDHQERRRRKRRRHLATFLCLESLRRHMRDRPD
jgi:DNA-binding NtrC family response regulator